MAYARCPHLLSDYIGQFHAALCRAKEPKECPKKAKTAKLRRYVTAECFNVRELRMRQPTGFVQFGDGNPTIPPDPQAQPATTEPTGAPA